LFKNAGRALSHGCVRVQQWEKLANYIIMNDSLRQNRPDSIKYVDSVRTWITNKERHRITIKYQFPLFIRYFGCEAVNGTIKFYDDIYGNDKILRERFFSQKKI
jgi:murein L,D-transpeptidase YcbB/YkuD